MQTEPEASAATPIPNASVNEELAEVSALEVFAQTPITTAEEYEAAAAKLASVKGALKRLEDKRVSITKPMNDSLKAVNAMFAIPKDRLDKVERQIKAGLVTYTEAEERKRVEAQRKADEEARAEKERAEKAAREIREKAERDAQALRDKAAAEAEAGRLDAAAALEAKADNKVERAEAKAVVHEVAAATSVAPVMRGGTPKVSGLRFTDQWNYEIENAALLPREYLMADDKKIGAIVKALKADAKIAGVRIWSTKVPASRSN